MKIYTKKGDDGTTALMNGKRVRKNALQIAVCGELDELNSFAGLAKSKIHDKTINKQLLVIQSDLFIIGSNIADVNNSKAKHLTNKHVEQLERWIDDMEAGLEPLSNFILPAGSEAVATLHVCRAVCRRAERSLVALHEKGNIDATVLQYINRLSDYFFLLARFTAKINKEEETVWPLR